MILAFVFAFVALLGIALWWIQHRTARKTPKAVATFPRAVVATHILEELVENKNKAQAFVTIYSDMLQKLRSLDQKATYEEAGDFIHRHVPLNRSVYDLYVEHCAVLGPALQKELGELYKNVRNDTIYDELTRETPRSTALRHLEKTIDEAQKLIAAIDPLVQTLQIVQRDSRPTAH